MIVYKKLWKLLIDRDMKKTKLSEISKVRMTSIAKLRRNENVNTEILNKNCLALKCDVSDIMEVMPENENTNGNEEE